MSQRLEHFAACPGQFWGDLGGFKRCCWVWEGVTPPKRNRQGWRKRRRKHCWVDGLMHNWGLPPAQTPHTAGRVRTPPLFMGDACGEGSPVVPKRHHLGLARSSIALRSWKGTEGVG